MSRFLAAFLVAALPTYAAPADAPIEVVEVRDGTVWDRAGTPHPTNGGVYLPSSSALAVAKRVAACEAERDELRQGPPPVLVVAMVVGIVIAGAAGFATGKSFR